MVDALASGASVLWTWRFESSSGTNYQTLLVHSYLTFRAAYFAQASQRIRFHHSRDRSEPHRKAIFARIRPCCVAIFPKSTNQLRTTKTKRIVRGFERNNVPK
jgi:hypothetical protein